MTRLRLSALAGFAIATGLLSCGDAPSRDSVAGLENAPESATESATESDNEAVASPVALSAPAEGARGARSDDDDSADEAVALASEPGLAPSGVFSNVAALCSAQMAANEHHLARVREERRAQRDDSRVEASCLEDAAALAGVEVKLAAPLRTVTAVRYQTGDSTFTSLVAETKDGFVAINPPFLTSYDDDPGCPSIERPAGLEEVSVHGDVVVVIDRSARGYGTDGDIMFRSARACSVGEDTISCGAPAYLHAELVLPHESRELFTTTFAIGPGAQILPASEMDLALLP